MIFSNICELKNDEIAVDHKNEDRFIDDVLLIYYDNDDICRDQETVVVEFHLENSYMYFPTLKKVVVSGKTYFLYCENYLNSDSEVPYNIIVFTDEVYDAVGNAVDRNTAMRVCAKYRLISMLM